MLYILIRTCPRDDFIGRLAMESLKVFYPTATYLFLAEPGPYSYLTGTIVYRTPCDNFGGQSGAKGLIDAMRQASIRPDPTDVVFLVDSDIVMRRDILSEVQDVDHAGIYTTSRWGLGHVSGQFQIVSGAFYTQLVALTHADIDEIVKQMLERGMDIADDTVFSYVSDTNRLRKKHISDGWVHSKFYEFNGRTDYETVLEIVRNRPLLNPNVRVD